MGLQAPFAPYLLFLFLEPVTNYLFRARLKTIRLKKQKQTQHNTRCHGNIDKQSERENYSHRKGTMVERINPITNKKTKIELKILAAQFLFFFFFVVIGLIPSTIVPFLWL